MWLRSKKAAEPERANRVVIYDDGTPHCLPAWARDEIVRLRIENYDLSVELMEAHHAPSRNMYAGGR